MAETDAAETPDSKPSSLVYVGAGSCLCAAISVGCCLGYNSPALPSMTFDADHPDTRSSVRLVSSRDTDTQSWIGSVMGIGALVGSLIAGKRLRCSSGASCAGWWEGASLDGRTL